MLFIVSHVSKKGTSVMVSSSHFQGDDTGCVRVVDIG